MKRAKIMLASVAVVAIVAGASAFKAKDKFGSVIYEAPAAGQAATIEVVNFTLNNNGSTTTRTGFFTTVEDDIVNTSRTAYSQQ